MVRMTFFGESKRVIDPKGRMILPREYREELRGGLFITKGFDNCLYIYPLTVLEEVKEKVKDMPDGNEKTRIFKRGFFSKANTLVPDGQGRILVPANLREIAGLDKEAMVVGVMDKVEVWNPKAWEEYEKNTEGQYDEAASEVGV